MSPLRIPFARESCRAPQHNASTSACDFGTFVTASLVGTTLSIHSKRSACFAQGKKRMRCVGVRATPQELQGLLGRLWSAWNTFIRRHRQMRQLPTEVDIVWAHEPVPLVEEQWGPIHVDGWVWDSQFSDDENLLNLAYAASLNTFRFQRGMAGGLFGAVLSRPPRQLKGAQGRRIEVLGVGVNYPPRFAEEAGLSTEGTASDQRAVPAQSRRLTGARATTLHAEVMVIARCAREGVATEGSWLYCIQPPCWECCKAVLQAGISRIVFQEPHAKSACTRQRDVVAATGAEWICVPASETQRKFLQEVRKVWSEHHDVVGKGNSPDEVPCFQLHNTFLSCSNGSNRAVPPVT